MNRQLMQAVLASADDDDDARLVYADWCEDEGDLARARLIRVQIERRRLSRWDVKQIALQVEEEKLIDDHGGRWIAELEPIDGITWTGFERGFVARAEADSFGALCGARDAIVQQTPLEHIKVPWPEDEARANSAPVFPTLRGLRIERAVRDREPYWLAQSPLLSTLTELALVDGFAEDPGTRAILNSKYLRKLKKLELFRHQVGAQGVHALVEADLPALEELKLEEHGPDDDSSWSHWEGGLELPEMQRLADWRGLTQLTRLDLSGNRIPESGFRALFRSGRLTSLNTLLLQHAYTNAPEMNWGALHCPLSEVGLSYHIVAGFDQTSTDCFAQLECLDLSNAVVEDHADITRILGPVGSTLRRLDFRSFNVDSDVWPYPPEQSPIRGLVGMSFSALHSLFVDFHQPYELDDFLSSDLLGQLVHLRIGRLGAVSSARNLGQVKLPRLQLLEVAGLHSSARNELLESPIGKRLRETGGLHFR